jgi:8-amino-7-oxononanoate synthase
VTFPSGYLSSLVLAQALAGLYEVILVDEAAHFCVCDAAEAMGRPVFTFKHRDPEHLRQVIKTKLKPGQRPLLLSDGVFPTFGRIAPLPDYARILETCDGLIGLDDAHGVGVLGPDGRGSYDYFGLKSANCHLAGTLSKAFGGYGGFIVGPRNLIENIKSRTGTYVGSTPIPTPLAAATAKGIEILRQHPEMRAKLHRNAALAKAGLKELGIPTEDTPVPIIAWSLSSEKKMVKVQQELMKRGIAIAYLKYAGAPAAGVLRVTIFSTHTTRQIQRLVEELAKIL